MAKAESTEGDRRGSHTEPLVPRERCVQMGPLRIHEAHLSVLRSGAMARLPWAQADCNMEL